MLTDDVILKRLQDKGWNCPSLRGQMENGTTALMTALSSRRRIPYQDQDLVEALLKHPSTDVHARDNEGRNAVWYAFDHGHAFPLLANAGADFNQLSYEGEHFLIDELQWVDLDSEKEVLDFMGYLELAVTEGKIDLLREYNHQPLWMQFPEPFESKVQILMSHQLKEHLETLPPAQGVKGPTKKL